MSKILLISNLTAGSFDKASLEETVEAFQKAGFDVQTAETFRKGDGAKIMAAASPEETPSVVVAGGGGVVSEVINTLMHRDDYDKFSVGIIPYGALNVLALEMGITEPAAAIAAICAGKTRKITLGEAKTPEGDRLFTVMASAGVDSWTVRHLNLKLKNCTGRWAYWKTFARVLLSRAAPSCRAEIDGKIYEGDVICACNGQYYGGPFRYSEVSELEDDEFEVVIMKKITVFELMHHIFSAPIKYMVPAPGSTLLKAKRLRIEASEKYPLQIDGDIINTLPAEISIFPRRLSLFTTLRIDRKR